MAVTVNPLAAHHLPSFITPPGETDTLLVLMAVILVIGIMSVGAVFFWLHSIPERRLHGTANKRHFELVAVLALLALFTHNNLFWVLALVLAMIDIPDFATPLQSMAVALKKMAIRRERRNAAAQVDAVEPVAPRIDADAPISPKAEA